MRDNRRTWIRFVPVAWLLGCAACSDAKPAQNPEPAAPPRPYVLVDVMGQFQRFADKLYFAGAAKNWELADWYLWKLEAAALPVIEGRIEVYRTEKYDVQPLMRNLLIPAIRALGEAIEKQSDADFALRYRALVQTCNACHTAAEHPFIRIVVPTAPIYTNQDYAP